MYGRINLKILKNTNIAFIFYRLAECRGKTLKLGRTAQVGDELERFVVRLIPCIQRPAYKHGDIDVDRQ